MVVARTLRLAPVTVNGGAGRVLPGPSLFLAQERLWLRPPRNPSLECREIGGRWDKSHGLWWFPPYLYYVGAIHETYPNLDVSNVTTQLAPKSLEGPLHHPSLARFRPYQEEALRFLLGSTHHGTLLVLSPRLGKSVVTLVAADILQASWLLVVAPKTAMRTWQELSREWTGHELTMRYGEPPRPDDGWTVTNYDTVVRHPEFGKLEWSVVIFDESILLSGRRTQRIKAMRQVSRHADKVWLLSGSPTSQHASGLWPQLNLIDSTGFPGFWKWASRMCVLEENNYGTKVVGTRYGMDVPFEHRDVMFVRSQKDVLPELPQYLVKRVTLELADAQRKAHDSMLAEFVAELENGTSIKATQRLSQIQRLQQIASNLCNLGTEWPDVSVKSDAVEELLQTGTIDLPTIIWTHWTPGAHALHARLTKHRVAEEEEGVRPLRVEVMDGKTTERRRGEIVRAFKAGEIDVLILALSVGKFALSLANVRTVIYLDRTFNADDYVQSLARAQHMESSHRPVLITLHCPHTADDLVVDNLAGKLPDIASLSNADLAGMLRALGKE